jgi:DNA-binding HxlR family transcriptional regulator
MISVYHKKRMQSYLCRDIPSRTYSKVSTMTKVKESSTLQQNKQISEMRCPITYTMNKIGGPWKAIILYFLMGGPKRYHELKKAIPVITEKMLAQNLKQLHNDELIAKDVHQLKPAITVYSLTPAGKQLSPVLLGMADWAMKVSDQFQHFVKLEMVG